MNAYGIGRVRKIIESTDKMNALEKKSGALGVSQLALRKSKQP